VYSRSIPVRPALLLIVSATFVLGLATTVSGQHPAIYLLDKDGEFINPIEGENQDRPFSTEQTCGMCHEYDEITTGYHFQMGWDEISDDFGTDEGRPWNLSSGFMGKWYPYAFRQLARKHNETPDEIDLTVYDFVGFSSTGGDQPPCGACHPGGGGLQFDRDGNRYDEELADNPELRESLDGDYYQSRWDKSGVVEADCFVCHFRGYNFEERIAQLEMGNYQWAVVAATGIGQVEGAVVNDEEPEVVYNRRFFNDDGTISLDMSWPPPAENCVNCHGRSDIKKRGFTWADVFNPDVHNQQGISCAACHPASLDHQIAKGDANVSTVADHLDNTMKGCRECHETGYLGASVPHHVKVRPSHLERISCEGCHIPTLQRTAALGCDATTGELVFTTNPPGDGEFGDHALWMPVYERRDRDIIYPLNSVITNWWGNLDEDGIIYPLFLREHEAGWRLFSDQVTDDNGDGEPEVNRDEEILAGLEAFGETLAGNGRFATIHPVYVKGGVARHLGENRTVAILEYDVTDLSYVNFSINHNVAPARMALGASGCLDCHGADAHFFKGKRTTDLCDADGAPVQRSIGRWYGCNPVAFTINSFHQTILSPVVSIGIILVVFLITLHYHSYGPKRVTFVPYSGEVRRFTLVERGVHLFRLISFVILGVTGLILAFNLHNWQELLFSSPQQMLLIHIGAGVVFIVTTAVGIVVWFKDAIFASYDKDWMRIIGGYLGHKGEVPAGRFNAGQKAFYWYTTLFGMLMAITGIQLIFKTAFPLSVTCVMSTIHNFFGFILIAGVLSHAYLGTIANPGTWRVLVDGYVTREWAEHHHPIWYKQLRASQPKVDSGEESEKK